MLFFKIIGGGGIGHFSVKHKQSQTQIMQIALFVGITLNWLARQGVKENRKDPEGAVEE